MSDARSEARQLAERHRCSEQPCECGICSTLDALVALVERLEQERDHAKEDAYYSKWPKEAAQEYHRLKADEPKLLARLAAVEAERDEAKSIANILIERSSDNFRRAEAAEARVVQLEAERDEARRVCETLGTWGTVALRRDLAAVEAERDEALKLSYEAVQTGHGVADRMEQFKAALERLGSMEAFTVAMDLEWIVPAARGVAEELRARIDFARSALAGVGGVPGDTHPPGCDCLICDPNDPLDVPAAGVVPDEQGGEE